LAREFVVDADDGSFRDPTVLNEGCLDFGG
jgi:hypothetical protein